MPSSPSAHPPPPSSSSPDVDPSSCSLLGPTALLVQSLMGIFVILSLLVKRQYEGRNGKTKRKWKVWMADVGKQLIGQAMVHASNLLISDQVSSRGKASINPCSLYFLNILVDTTVGVLVLYVALKSITYLCIRYYPSGNREKEGFLMGVYGDPLRWSYFFRQLLIYLLSLTLMKLSVLLLFSFILSPILLPIAGWVLDWMDEWMMVVFVMAVFPLGMNVLQFCIIDSLIKAGSIIHPSDSHPSSSTSDVESQTPNLKTQTQSRLITPFLNSSHHHSRMDDNDDDDNDDDTDRLLPPSSSSSSTHSHSSHRPKRKTPSRTASPGISSALLGREQYEPISPALSAGYGGIGEGSGNGALSPEDLGLGLGQARMNVGFGFGETNGNGNGGGSANESGKDRMMTAHEKLKEVVQADKRRSAAVAQLDAQDYPGRDIDSIESTGTISHRSNLSDEVQGQARRTLSADGKGEGDDRTRTGSHPLKKYNR